MTDHRNTLKGGNAKTMESNQNISQRVRWYSEMVQQLKSLVNDEYGVVILQEIAKDMRCEKLNGNHRLGNNNSDEPATAKQLKYLKQLGTHFDKGITKKEASQLIEEAKAIHGMLNDMKAKQA